MFAEPRRGVRAEDCFFYHVCDLPDGRTVGGHWDLRGSVDEYLGRAELAGRQALDVGTASGFLTFEMERRGAAVTSFDVLDETRTKIVPFHNDPLSLDQLRLQQRDGFRRLKNSYWYLHELFDSKARAFYGDVRQLPEQLGTFDVVFIGMCLPHMRDPLGALESVSRRAADRIVITQQAVAEQRPVMELIPRSDTDNIEHLRFAWWLMSDGCIEQFLDILGFDLEYRYRAKHLCVAYEKPRHEQCTTYGFRRRVDARPGLRAPSA